MRTITLLFCLLVPALALAAPLGSGQELISTALAGQQQQSERPEKHTSGEKFMTPEAKEIPQSDTYVFITPVYAAEHLAEGEAPEAYEGVAFPIYCGYVVFNDEGNMLRFYKKTELPIQGVVNFFEQMRMHDCFPVSRKDTPTFWAFSNDNDAVCRNNFFYPAIIYMKANPLGIRCILAADTKADPNFAPEFKETYVYRRNAPKSEWENRFTDPINRYVKYTGEYPFWLTPMH